MSGLDPLGMYQHREFLGSGLSAWILLIFGIVLISIGQWFGWAFMVFWIENFGFWLIPRIFKENDK